MNKTVKVCLFTAIILTILIGVSIHKKQPIPPTMPTEFALLALIDDKVLDTIRYSNEIPGFSSETFSALKNELSTLWSHLFKDGIVEKMGSDQDFRPYFVALQGVVEHVLASELQQNVHALMGIIHTPMPATPLCTRGEISKELVHPSIEADAARLFSVQARTTTLRDYLFKGGDLYIVYPKRGYDQRTEEQKQIYKTELAYYPDHLFDVPLACEHIPTELTGATYLFQDQWGNQFVFAIKMTQANNPQETGHFGLWFGPMDDPAIQQRVQAVSKYMEQHDVKILTQCGGKGTFPSTSGSTQPTKKAI